MFFQCLNAKIESAEKLAGNTTAEINCDGREAGDQKKEIHAVDYRDTIQESLDYIEDNLDTEITAEELSSRAGFSLFYFYRLFQAQVGMPVMQYILRRRLVHAIYDISCGAKMVDAALRYGFDTHAGFFRAFRREYDCSPSNYLKRHKPKRPYRINLRQEGHVMLTQKKIKEILSHWGMEQEKISSFYYESSGFKSDRCWYVGENYLLKTGENLPALKRHLEVSEAVRQAGLEAAVYVPAKNGEKYIMDEDTYFCLTRMPEGEFLLARDLYAEQGNSRARYVGEILGQLHLIMKDMEEQEEYQEDDLLACIKGWALPGARRAMELPDEFCIEFEKGLEALYPMLPVQLIHHNPTPSDFLIRQGKPAGFIEFENTEKAIRLFDPCYVSTGILSESFEDGNEEKLRQWGLLYQNILRGYDSVNPLSEKEKEALPYIVFSIQMICVEYFSESEKYAELAEINQKMLRQLIAHRDMLTLE